MKKANKVMISLREASNWPFPFDGKQARRLRAQSYAVEFGESFSDVINLLWNIACTVKKETVRHG